MRSLDPQSSPRPRPLPGLFRGRGRGGGDSQARAAPPAAVGQHVCLAVGGADGRHRGAPRDRHSGRRWRLRGGWGCPCFCCNAR
eukprot:10527829-Alexandrium_andersonii.AAC.1